MAEPTNCGQTAVQKWAGSEEFANLENIRILVVGAGGLGCEILKNLVATGFQNLSVIDMDTIDLTNLNRQFLFREADIGQYKAKVAAQRVSGSRIPVKSYINKIQDMPNSFYEQFHIVICGLDNVEARRWINAKLVNLCLSDSSLSSLRPLIDGGSEGFCGQCRVILPGITPCYECTLSLLLSDSVTNFPLCTIASVPRLPEHCVQWASLIRWPQVFGATPPDFDSEKDMRWLYDAASKRAKLFSIDGVTLSLVYGVLKRIIPAVASTNAVIAAACSLEALKLSIGKFDPIDNYLMYAGNSGIFSSVIKFEKRADCAVCGTQPVMVRVRHSCCLQELLAKIMDIQKLDVEASGQLPSVSAADGKVLYLTKPESLRRQTESNLSKTIAELVPDTTNELAVTHPKLPLPIRVLVEVIP